LAPVRFVDGFDPNTPLEACRNRNVVALKIRSIGEAAQLRVNSKGDGFEIDG
jgi:hypothetical protein